MKKHSIRAVILLMVFFLVPAFATTVRELNWDDLKPVIEFDDPFEKLTRDQLYYLGIVARVRQMQENGKQVSEPMQQETDEAEAILVKEDVDIDGLLAKRAEVREMRHKHAESVVPELDGKPVIIPGFVLPLEYAGTKVTEFLLVPWVGACIHTPPPPANQIIHVIVDENQARESKRLFEPVSVTGTMFTKQMSKSLYLVDGSSNINIGYAMHASMIEPYKKESNSNTQPKG
jgi:hypothetical protein